MRRIACLYSVFASHARASFARPSPGLPLDRLVGSFLFFVLYSFASLQVFADESVKPAVPVNVSPEAGATLARNSTVIFSWQSDPVASVYDFYLFDRDSRGRIDVRGIDAAEICDTELCNLSVEVAAPVGARHLWRVRAINSAGRSSWSRSEFSVAEPVSDPPESPLATLPIAGALTETGAQVKFQWEPSNGADSYDFSLLDRVSGVEILVNQLAPGSYCSELLCTLRFDVDMPLSSNHVWRVRARNLAGESDWTETLLKVIAVATAKPSTPENLAPVSGSDLVQGDMANFSWSVASQAATYELRLFDNDTRERTYLNDLDPDMVCGAEQCDFETAIELSVFERHYWNVRARNSMGVSSWSSLSRFNVVSDSVQELDSPQTLAPQAGMEVIEGEVLGFSWLTVADATAFDFELVAADGSVLQAAEALSTEQVCADEQCLFSIPPATLQPGTYHWRVRALNLQSQSEWAEVEFDLVAEPVDQQPVASITASTLTGVVPLTVSFDATASTDDNGIVNYAWQFGNEESVSAEDLLLTEYTFEDAGSVVVTLTVTDDTGQQNSDSLTITTDANQPPIASFAFVDFTGEASGAAPLNVSVDPAASTDDNGIISYQWDFGDDSEIVTELSAQIIEHSYETPGDYAITLTVYDSQALFSSTELSVTVDVAEPEPEPEPENATAVEAARLLSQATFGPTVSAIADVRQAGVESWIDQQLQLQGPAHLDYVLQHSNGSNRWPRHEVWWSDAVNGEDQLRQRVAFALSQIFVVSDTSRTLANAQYGVTHYYDLLRERAFGNYRDLLETVTLNPIMGIYLSMLQNAKGDMASSTRADENYAREVLQLFSIGLYNLNLDGSSTGTPAFTQQHVEEFARVFTGWNYKNAGQWNRRLFSGQDLTSAMEPFEEFHDSNAKTLLGGVTAPAGLDARADLQLALDNIFNHPNVGPFIGKQLIQRLVTSNPSPGYVARVATMFNDNGVGVRGDMAAVVRAILLDVEARNENPDSSFGKLREPVLKLSHLWRAFNIQRGNRSSARGEYNTFSPQMDRLEEETGQAVLRSNSVFNFYKPDYSPSGEIRDNALVAPEFEILTENNQLATANRISRQIHKHYKSTNRAGDLDQSYVDFTFEMTLASDAAALLDHLDLLLLNGSMSSNLRDILTNHINQLADTVDGRGQRVRDAVSLIMASPEYAVQR